MSTRAKLFIGKLLEEFPEETEEAILKITNEGTGHAEARGHAGPQT